ALNFALRAGEIVGIAGLVGAGRTELLQTLFGVTPPVGGRLRVDGREVALRSPEDAIRAGVALVPEDRKQQGLLLEMSVRTNLSLPSLRRLSRARLGVFRDRAGERDVSLRMVRELGVRTPGDGQMVQYLSGGN